MDSITNFEKAVELLKSQGRFHISLGVDRIKSVLKIMTSNFKTPEPKYIHIAGTNGKGSVCAMLNSILNQTKYSVGLYTSPHIFSYTERIKVNNENIDTKTFSELIFEVVNKADEANIHLTEFEILTVVGFLYFRKKNVDIVILETGLGGRLDATNVIEDNLLSIITSISKDHTERLGTTIEEIAFEKAGIIKKSPVIINKSNLGYETISKRKMPLKTTTDIEIFFKDDVNYANIDGKEYEFSLLGLYQKDNLELVVNALKYLKEKGFDIKESHIKDGLKNVKWNCRMEYFKEKNLLIDAAHNPDGALRLRESLDFYFPNKKFRFIYGCLQNKDYQSISTILFKEGDEVAFFEFNYNNSLTFNEFNKICPHSKPFNRCLTNDKLNIVCGSFYMIKDLLNIL